MIRISRSAFASLAAAIGLAAAPQLFAQSRVQSRGQSQLLVCRDGGAASARHNDRACDRHGGVDWNATTVARRDGLGALNGINRVNGVSGINAVLGNRNRSVYNGNNSNNRNNRSVLGSVNGRDDGTWNRDRDDDDDDDGGNGRINRDDRNDRNDGDDGRLGNGHGRGHAFGHFKHKHGEKDDDDRE